MVLLTFAAQVGVDRLPGDPVITRLGPSTPLYGIAELRQALGLDRPVSTR
ncbi:hypothetical protein [Amycolatopsis sp. lyj-90]